MKYYKITKDNNFIGIATSNDFVRSHTKYRFLENVDETAGQFIICNGLLYRTTWMQPLPQKEYSYTKADIEEIDETLYMNLANAIATNEEIQVDPNPPMTELPTPEIEQDNQLLLEYVRSAKLKELSYECNQAIENGIDYNGQHYALTQYDQINLINAQIAIINGASTISYHADNEAYRNYSAAEINAIITLANEHKETNLQHFNKLKAYINTLNTINELSAIKWSDVYE